MAKKENIPENWLQEILNETEHYYQGEIQQEQRASWLLATSSALIALLIGLQLSAIERNISIPTILPLIAVALFFLSSIVSILVILPVKDRSSFWADLFGSTYRSFKKQNIDELLKKRFRHNAKWSEESKDQRTLKNSNFGYQIQILEFYPKK